MHEQVSLVVVRLLNPGELAVVDVLVIGGCEPPGLQATGLWDGSLRAKAQVEEEGTTQGGTLQKRLHPSMYHSRDSEVGSQVRAGNVMTLTSERALQDRWVSDVMHNPGQMLGVHAGREGTGNFYGLVSHTTRRHIHKGRHPPGQVLDC